MTTSAFEIPTNGGHALAARLETPEGPARAYALFAHCFTCGKDSAAAVRISRALAARGIATLRFDVTGVGASGGDFAATTFSSGVDELAAAAEAMSRQGMPPSLLIGHSLGGAAAIAAAHRLPTIRAVTTIGAPADVAHVLHQLGPALETIEREGEGAVTLGQRSFMLRKTFVEDTRAQPQLERIASLRRALLVLHAPTDSVVGIDNASTIFATAKHPKSFVSLDTADHFLSSRADADYAAGVIAAWAERFLPAPVEAPVEVEPPAGAVSVRETRAGRFQNRILVAGHRLLADEPASVGGGDSGPSPYDLLAAALGACTSMTLRLYAERKGLALERIEVSVRHGKIHAADCADCETREGRIDLFEVTLGLDGALDEGQRRRLTEIAAMCPVHRTLHGEVKTRIGLLATAAQGP